MSQQDSELTCTNCGAQLPPGARFCPSCATPVAVSHGAEPESAAAQGDELRPMTALFADIVGSTGLGERLGPDEVKALIGECVSRMSRSVEEFGGTIQAYMGDGICAYFGLPVAHEDDQERAARAALRILQVVGEYSRDIEAGWGIAGFNVRVGINSGQTAVGVVGAGNPQEVALGDTTNVAARLQSATQPGTIAVGEAAAQRLAKAFELEPIGDLSVKGRTEAVPAWRLIGPRTAPEPAPGAPLVGRDHELARLSGVVDELVAGRGQVLLITGEAGIGKTRLLTELEAVAGDRVTWLEGRCLSYGGELLYWPFVEMLRGWLGVGEGEAEVAVRTRLRARLSALFGPDSAAASDTFRYLGRLLSVRLELEMEQELHPPPPEVLGQAIRAAFATWIERLATSRPVVVAVDDMHWADPSTRQLAEELLPLSDRAPFLLAAAFRPDPASEGWRFRIRVLTDFAHRAVELPLTPLSNEAAERLLDQLMPMGLLDAAARGEIVARAEGNPLYLEELLRALLEAGGADRRRTWTLPSSAAGMLPPNLESLFIARIDRLPSEARRLAQAAAVIGRTFPVRVLARVVEEEDVSQGLAVLLRSEVVRELRRFPELECTFRHGLLQEAALSTLTPARRRELYARVAEAFEEVLGETTEERLETLALYWYRSDRQDRALEYLERAASRAASIDARKQAAELYARALKVAGRLGDAEAEKRVQARLEELDATG